MCAVIWWCWCRAQKARDFLRPLGIFATPHTDARVSIGFNGFAAALMPFVKCDSPTQCKGGLVRELLLHFRKPLAEMTGALDYKGKNAKPRNLLWFLMD